MPDQEHRERTNIEQARNKIGSAILDLISIHSDTPRTYAAQSAIRRLKECLWILGGIRGPDEPAGYEEGENK